MIILGIETSCDETALSLIEIKEDGVSPQFKVLGNKVLSQIKLHEQYGGVFPMMAKREHAKNLVPLLAELLKETGFEIQRSSSENNKNIESIFDREPELYARFISYIPTIEKPAIDAIAVTTGPGLEPALWVGITFARALSECWNIPAIPTNHMEGHIVSSLMQSGSYEQFQELRPLMFPALALLISGGHTELVLIKSWKEYEVIGQTRDDAVGEAFDKVARILGLPYPGGPQISALAQKAREANIEVLYPLPRPMIHSKDYDFSFSGIKTAVLYTVQKIENITPEIRENIAREFEDSVTEVLMKKTLRAIQEFGIKTLMIGGGVVANAHIREEFSKLTTTYDIELLVPDQHLSTDNALMIALAGYFNNKADNTDILKAKGTMSLS